MDTLTATEKRNLFDACENGQLDVVAAVLNKHPGALNIQNSEGWTPLTLAVQWAQVETVEYLLGRGADAALPDKTGATPQTLAERLNYESIIDIFRAASRRRERQEQEAAQVAAIGQFHTGLEAAITMPRGPLRLCK